MIFFMYKSTQVKANLKVSFPRIGMIVSGSSPPKVSSIMENGRWCGLEEDEEEERPKNDPRLLRAGSRIVGSLSKEVVPICHRQKMMNSMPSTMNKTRR
jgi:hypothetical protein